MVELYQSLAEGVLGGAVWIHLKVKNDFLHVLLTYLIFLPTVCNHIYFVMTWSIKVLW